jgi:branched-chain amino acid transport system permease protein
MFNRLGNNQFPDYLHKNDTLFTIFGAQIKLLQVVIIVAAVLLMIFLDRLVSGTKLGRGIRATAEDAPTAALMGVDIDRTISRTFIIGGALAGAAGFLFGYAFVFTNTMGFIPGLLLGIAENLIPTAPWISGQDPWIGQQWTDVVAFVILILILVFRPTGILGERLGRAA